MNKFLTVTLLDSVCGKGLLWNLNDLYSLYALLHQALCVVFCKFKSGALQEKGC